MNQQEQMLLIDSLIDGSIGEADLLRIEAELIVDPEVRRHYYRQLQLDMLLEQEAREVSTAESPRPVTPSQQGRWLKILSGTLVTITASTLLMIFFAQPNGSDISPFEPGTGERTEPSASGFAILNGQDKAIWSGSQLAEGDLLPTGKIHLLSGRAYVELFSGVQMVLEGDSLLSIDSPMQVTLHRGIARARVPEPAQGFKIKTASGDIIDLGTEFGIHVDEDGAEVHVVDGEVELRPRSSQALCIDAGTSRRLSRSGGLVDALSSSPRTIGPREFQRLLQQKQEERFANWNEARRIAQTDRRLVAYYQFLSPPSQAQRLENLAGAARPATSDGSVVAATPTTDRWGRNDAALDFSRVGSRVRIHVPGEYQSLTLLCWVKINSLDRWYNSLFLTDGHDDGEPHWQMMDDGRIFFSVKVPRRPGDPDFVQPVFYSPKIWDSSLSGRWMMLGVTYDTHRAKVTHYVNGRPVSSEPIAEEQIVESTRIGSASICNWSEPMYRTDPKFVLRNLNGSMDEFAMYSDALSADEILQLYRDGYPNEL